MGKKKDVYSTVARSMIIDQRAVKIFSDWLPDEWLLRKQKPDFFVDFLIEMVDNGEPTGQHFAAQIKGFEEPSTGKKSLSYSFKTKHLRYYRDKSQNPVFLFLINTTTREGFWLFAQKRLKMLDSFEPLKNQKNFTIRFSQEASLKRLSEFKSLLPKAEQFVRDLHPGSISAATKKRKTDLESMDPRCSISISVKDEKEHIEITPKQNFSFTTKIRSADVQDWTNFIERGEKIKLKQEEIDIIGAPILKEVVTSCGDIEIQYGNSRPGSLHIISRNESKTTIPIGGQFQLGSKFMIFRGELPQSPLGVVFQTTFKATELGRPIDLSVSFSPTKWVGQNILSLAHLDQIIAFAKAFVSDLNPEMEILVDGNTILKGEISRQDFEVFRNIHRTVEWFEKCCWIGRHYKVNPAILDAKTLTSKVINKLNYIYEILKNGKLSMPCPKFRHNCFGPRIISKEEMKSSDRTLRIGSPQQIFDFFGIPLRLGPFLHTFTDIDLVSQRTAASGKIDVVFAGTKNSIQTTSLR